MTSPAGNRQVLVTGAGYLPFGPSTGWQYGNGRSLSRTFDLDYRPTGIADNRQELALSFGYDPVGNLTVLNVGGEQHLIDYDALGRLTAFRDAVTGTAIETYGYDATGNRLLFANASRQDAYTYPSDSHRLTAVAGIARTYDAAGNTTSVGGTSKEFVYDDRGRLAQVKTGGAVAQQYAYNGKGERVRRWLGSNATLTAYDEAGQWLGDYDASGLAKQQAIWMDDKPIGLLADGQLYYIEPDHLGSPRLVVDPARDVAVWRWDLNGEAFGNTAPNEDPDGDGTPLVLDMRFPGQRFDAASGLNYNYFRDYDFSAGRYIQSDPLGLSDGSAIFQYVGASPFRWKDPLGLFRFDDSVKVKYPKSVALINDIKNSMNDLKYQGFARYGKIGKNHLDDLLSECGGPVVRPKYLPHDFGMYEKGSGVIYINEAILAQNEAGQDVAEVIRKTVEHELVHYTEYFWGKDQYRGEEGQAYEIFVYGKYP